MGGEHGAGAEVELGDCLVGVGEDGPFGGVGVEDGAGVVGVGEDGVEVVDEVGVGEGVHVV